MDADGSNVAELSDTPNTFGYVYPAWSPDGKQLAWTQPTDDGLDIYTVGADGKGAKRLTKLGGLTTYAAWSPDGKTIAFYHTKENEKGAYYRVDPSGDNLKPFLKDELPVEGGRPAWRPRGK
jgi:TolB protein